MAERAPGMTHSEERRPETETPGDEQSKRDKGMDHTLADSYPASDPPSSIPDPLEEEDAA